MRAVPQLWRLLPTRDVAVAADWLMLLLRTREARGSNLVPETGYADLFCGLPQFLRESTEIVPQILARPLSFTSSPVHYSLIPAILILFMLKSLSYRQHR
jgi:hypothetical protein